MTVATAPDWLTYGRLILAYELDLDAGTLGIDGDGFDILVAAQDDSRKVWRVTLWRYGGMWSDTFSRNEVMMAFGELAESLPPQHQGYVYPRAQAGAIGKFLRRGSVLRIPGPPLGADEAPGVSVEVDRDVRIAMVKLLR